MSQGGVASRGTALVAGGLVVVLLAVGWPLSAMAHQLNVSNDGPDILILAGASVGVIVAWHQPRNPMGWIMLATMGCIALSNAASFYSVADYRLHHGTLPLGWVAVLLQPAWAPTIILLGLAILLFPDGRPPSPRWRWVLVVYLVVGLVWLAGAAYALVTGLLVGVYAGAVLLATHVLTLSSPVAVAGSTLAAVALFNPLRRRVQHRVDRRFNRARYDADQTVAAFAARLKDTVDLDSVRDDLAGVVHRALEPAHVSVWTNERG